MERVLILGGSGMLGHKLAQVFAGRFETWTSVRRLSALAGVPRIDGVRVIEGFDAQDVPALDAVWAQSQPTVVVNAIGVIKQLPSGKDPVTCIAVNSLFPHRVAALTSRNGCRLIHVSTDCVFSGKKGGYAESDTPDADDLYGRSKLLGEVVSAGALTLRTSIIGRELGTAHGLVEWFLAQEGSTAKGYSRAIFSGLPTLVLARTIADIIESHPALTGLYHLSADPIAKYKLLHLLREVFAVTVEIEKDETVAVDRSLDSTRFRSLTGFAPSPWPVLVEAMARDASKLNCQRR